MTKLNTLSPPVGSRRVRKRKGRGIGSGKGKTSGRGHKGAKARAGTSLAGFEGGQMPIHMRLPKRGFNNPFGSRLVIVNLGRVQDCVDAQKLDIKNPVTEDALLKAGVIRRVRDGVRLLAKGTVKSKIDFCVTGVSAAARAAVETCGGSITLIKKAPREKK